MSPVSKRNSLATLVYFAFIVIVVLSLFSTFLSYNHLKNFNTILNEITNESLPEVTKANQVNSVLKQILYLTERMTNASNHASRRIAMEDLANEETKLTKLLAGIDDNFHFNNQIKTTRNEIVSLNLLVQRRIDNQALIQSKIAQAYDIQDRVINQISELNTDRVLFEKTVLSIFDSVSISNKALGLTGLQPVRQISKIVNQKINNILFTIQKEASKLPVTIFDDITQLKALLLSDTGLFNLKVEQLQIAGRTRGRGNFIHNLVADISRLSEANFYQINDTIVNEAQNTTKQIAKQVKWSISLAIVVVFLLILTIYIINQKIVARILALNLSVIRRIKEHDSPINVDGNDEISHLARSVVYFSKKVEQQKKQLEKLSLTDGLTSLPNRRALDERLEHDTHITKRGNSPLSIILLDIDYFKPFNDFYGHVAGDECLKSVANSLKAVCQRESDFLARYGGEEFVLLLPSTDKEGAIKVAQEIKDSFAQLNYPHEKSKIKDYVTVSIGITTFTKETILKVDSLLTKTDEALYYSKGIGRNTYTHSDDIN